MSITNADIQKVANLAKIDIAENELDETTASFQKIMDLVAQMNQVNTDNIVPLAHPLDDVQPLRNDQITEHNQRDLYQSVAPDVYAGLYIVPKVIEQE